MQAIRGGLYPISGPQTDNDHPRLAATKPKLAEVLGEQKPDKIQQNQQGGMTVQAESKYIPMSVQQTDTTITAIDSVVELDPNLTNTITNKLNKEVAGLTTSDTATKEYQTLSHLQDILEIELGTISNISSAESEQTQAITKSDTGIIKSQELQQKMCTLRAGYSAQVLSKLGREVTTLCGSMDGEGHARNILKTPSGECLMFDPMNPQMHQGHPFVNSLAISSSEYYNRKNGQSSPITMTGHQYSPHII